MALVKTTGKVAWDVSTSADTASYNVYFSVDGSEVSYDSTFVNVATTELDLSALGVTAFEGLVKLGVAAVDAAGNVSDIAPFEVTVDTVAPAAPSNVRFVA